jgi:hypothetical protein
MVIVGMQPSYVSTNVFSLENQSAPYVSNEMYFGNVRYRQTTLSRSDSLKFLVLVIAMRYMLAGVACLRLASTHVKQHHAASMNAKDDEAILPSVKSLRTSHNPLLSARQSGMPIQIFR